MGNRDYLQRGTWNAICDICGFKFKAFELKKNWKNEMACESCWEPRHPQDYIRIPRDNPAVAWTRPEAEDEFIGPACFIWDQHGYVGLGTVGCMQVGKNTIPSIQLYALKYPTP